MDGPAGLSWELLNGKDGPCHGQSGVLMPFMHYLASSYEDTGTRCVRPAQVFNSPVYEATLTLDVPLPYSQR